MSARLAWANSLRGLAAVMVMVGHLFIGVVALQAYSETIVGYSPGVPVGDALHLAWLADLLGFDVMGAGVCVFFLLSGLVISRSLGRYSRRGFVVGRALRLLPTYAAGYAAIVATIAGLALLTGSDVPVGPADLLGLVPGLPQLVGVTTLPNSVAWSLVVEIAFYGVCVVLYRRLRAGGAVLLAVAAACVIGQQVLLRFSASSYPVVGLVDIGLLITPFLPVLLIGVQLDALMRRQGPAWVAWTTVVLLTAAMVWMTQFRILWPWSPVGVNGAGAAAQATYVVTIVVFILIWRSSPARFDGPVLRWLASISYPLYVVHLMVGTAVILLLVGLGLPGWLAQLTGVTAAVLLAWGLHHAVEMPTHRLGQRWARRLSPEPVDVPPTATVTRESA